MKRLLLVPVALPMLSLSLLAAEPEVVFEDTFHRKPAEGWTWLRENSDAWRIKDHALEIRVEPGMAHNVKNALVRPAPDRSQGKYAIEVTITSHTVPTQQFEQAGITWYQNDKPVFKLVKELVNGKLPAPGKDQVSIQCYNGPPEAEHWIRFDDFRILKLAE